MHHGLRCLCTGSTAHQEKACSACDSQQQCDFRHAEAGTVAAVASAPSDVYWNTHCRSHFACLLGLSNNTY